MLVTSIIRRHMKGMSVYMIRSSQPLVNVVGNTDSVKNMNLKNSSFEFPIYVG